MGGSHSKESDNIEFMLASFFFVPLSVGTAQLTYVISGPITFGYGMYKTARLFCDSDASFGKAWAPFAIATSCLVPFIGGLVAAKIFTSTY